MPMLESTAEELQNDAALVFVRKLISALAFISRSEISLRTNTSAAS